MLRASPAIMAAVLLLPSGTDAAAAYSVADLGTLGGTHSEATDINASGQVVGWSYVSGDAERHAFLYSGGSMDDLGSLAAKSSEARGINASGQVVGWTHIRIGDSARRAFIYSGGSMQALGTLGGWASFALAVSDSGQVVGWSNNATADPRAFLYSGGSMQDLGTLGGTASGAMDINARGDVVGWSCTTGCAETHAFLYSGGFMRDLGALGGYGSTALGINTSGQVVGYSSTISHEEHAFLYSGGSMQDLGTLGGSSSRALDINASGQVVGYSSTSGGERHAFLYSGGSMQDLNLLVDPLPGWTITEARAINDLGQIAAIRCAASPAGRCHAVRLDPIPAAGPTLVDLSPKNAVVAGCKNVTGTVTLSAPAPAGGLVVALSDTLAAASMAATVTVPEGATSKTFTIRTVPVAAAQSGQVSATLAGTTLSQNLTVRPMGLTALTLSPTSVAGGKSSTGTARLECAAGPGPVTVELSSSNAAIANPVAVSVVVPQGLQAQAFDVATEPVLSKSSATIHATAHGITKSKALTVTPAATVSPTSLKFGNQAVGTTSATLTVTLYNEGAVSFAVTGISLTATNAKYFAHRHDCPGNLAAGSACTIGVTFSPTVTGSKAAQLSIATSATGTPLRVALSGTGY